MLKHHDKIERNSIILLILTVIVISIGGLVEITPLFRIETTIEKVEGMRPYTPLELAGAKIYKREGCYGCHSQQVRVLRDEVERYGHYSIASESMYDYPFQWGSKRTGPDLARIGGKYSDEWHTRHLVNPRSVVPESIMPGYKFLLEKDAQIAKIADDMEVLKKIGVPYSDDMIQNAVSDAVIQASTDRDGEVLLKRYGKKVTIRDFDGNPQKVSEMDALVAYLQVLGTLVDFAKFEPLTIKEFNELQQNIKNSQSSEQPIEPTNSNLNNENVK
ncbi:MAG: cytochrome-c oxidase, cbb3-type subunit II [Proteobacteria bacterium]|nr:cytochrome-c oxidase, cbb3-type subunit II [Pseudomonadota bacterium]NCA28000.1 cytochrome-c oxidase, cbb3-type subunit II [Pseudomonadota bacterium]